MEFVKCDLCGSNDEKLFLKIKSSMFFPGLVNSSSKIGTNPPEFFRIVKCKKCGLVYVNPRYDFEEEKKSYEDYKVKKAKRLSLLQRLRKRSTKNRMNQLIRKIKKYKKNGSFLDVGCAKGDLLATARAHGFDVFGVEPSLYNYEIAKSKGLDVFNGTLEESKFNKKFDVITMTDVIEHVPSPVELIKTVDRMLKGEGLFVVSTQDIETLNARLSGKYWEYFGPATHLYYFSRKTLTKLLGDCGFIVAESKIDNKMLRHFVFFFYQLSRNALVILLVWVYGLTKVSKIKELLKSKSVEYWPALVDHRIVFALKK